MTTLLVTGGTLLLPTVHTRDRVLVAIGDWKLRWPDARGPTSEDIASVLGIDSSGVRRHIGELDEAGLISHKPGRHGDYVPTAKGYAAIAALRA